MAPMSSSAKSRAKPYDRARSSAAPPVARPDASTSTHGRGSQTPAAAIDVDADDATERKPVLAHLNDASAARSRALTSRKALQSETNPITNSTSYSRACHLVSASSGHQQDCGGRTRAINNDFAATRNAKLRHQAAAKQTSIFQGVSIWINGLVGCGLSNLQLVEMVQANGGEWRPNFSKRGTTHMISIKELSASKTHNELTHINSTTRIVHTQWVIDSVAAGRRLPETPYLVLSRDPAISKVFAPVASSSSSKPAAIRSGSGSSSTSASSLDLPPTPVSIELNDELAWLSRKSGNVKVDPNAMPPSAQRHV